MFAFGHNWFLREKLLYLGKMVIFGQTGCICENVALIKHSGSSWEELLHSGKADVFGQNWSYSGKVVVFGQKWLYSGKMVAFGQKWLYSGKVVVFGQNCCILAKWLY